MRQMLVRRSVLGCGISCTAVAALFFGPSAWFSLHEAFASEAQQALAPTGKLRVGLLDGDATQAIKDSASGELKGVGFDLGDDLARRLGVPFEPVLYPSIGRLLDGGKAGAWDVAFLGVTPARAKEWDFAAPHLEVEFGYLIGAGSSIATVADVDRSGVRVAVQERSGPEAFASRALKNGVLVRAPDYATAVEMLKSGKADVIFSIKPILFELSDKMPGSRVLDGSPGSVPQAMAIPKGRDAGLEYARRFIDEAKSEGIVKRAVQRVGLRGIIIPAGQTPSR
jgi:polar amino acid transport system substrate-binding protein